MIGDFQKRWDAHGEPKIGDLMFFGPCAFGTMYLVLRITRITKTRAVCSHFCIRKRKWVEHSSFTLRGKAEVGYSLRRVSPYDNEVVAHLAKIERPILHPETLTEEFHPVIVTVTGWRGTEGKMHPMYTVELEGKKYRREKRFFQSGRQESFHWEQWVTCSEKSAMVSHWRALKNKAMTDRLDHIIIERQQSGLHDDSYQGGGE
ncbi:hypothetical protein [Pseudomonas phage UF_RH7]|nr:hypothetical protein [Pseudomonas phage UF_RH7]